MSTSCCWVLAAHSRTDRRPTQLIHPYHTTQNTHEHGRADALKGELEGFRTRERELVARAALAQTDLETVQAELARVQVRVLGA